MKKFISKVLYFIYDGIARMNEFFGRYHIISEKAMWTNISNSVDGMDFAVRRLMGRDSYRRYGSSICSK